VGLAAKGADPKTIMIDATDLKEPRTAYSLRAKKECGRQIGRTKGGINTKLHAVTDAKGRPIRFPMSAGQISDLHWRGGASGQPAAGRLVIGGPGL
jgi:hypothetical protein